MQHQLGADKDLIAYKANKHPALYAAFFPGGRTEYTNATLLTAELLLTRASTAATHHTATLRADPDAAPCAQFLATFLAAGTGAGNEQSAEAQHPRQDLPSSSPTA